MLMFNRTYLALLMILSVGATYTLRAQESGAKSSSLPQTPVEGRVGVDLRKTHPLSLRDAILLALQNNRDIEI